jgi:hypothetical protein
MYDLIRKKTITRDSSYEVGFFAAKLELKATTKAGAYTRPLFSST